jgi:hypothetical protein
MALTNILRSKRKNSPVESKMMKAEEPQAPPAREQDAIYQNGKLVARVLGPQVDREQKKIRFAEIYNSDELLLPDECEFQGYRIIVQRVGFGSGTLPGAAEKGRILRDCGADILGHSPP